METSYEQVLEAVRRYPRDLKLQELPRDTSGKTTMHSAAAQPMTETAALRCTPYEPVRPGKNHAALLPERNTAMPLPLPMHWD